jgi:hypothetical protein
MSSREWSRRTVEERTLLNPPFVARVVQSVADGYAAETGEGVPFPLIFLAVPAALHQRTRVALPTTVRTSLRAWTLEHSFLRATFALRASAIASHVREGALFGISGGLLTLNDGSLLVVRPRGKRRRSVDSEEVKTILSRARFVGRWFARSGDVASIYASWGVRP